MTNQDKTTPAKSLGDQLKDVNKKLDRFVIITIFIFIESLCIIGYLAYQNYVK